MTKKAALYHRVMGPLFTQADMDKLNEVHALAAEHGYHFVAAQLDRSNPSTGSDSALLEELLESEKIDAIIITYPGSGSPIIWTKEAGVERLGRDVTEAMSDLETNYFKRLMEE